VSPTTAICLLYLTAELVQISLDLLQLFGAGKGLRLTVAKRQVRLLNDIHGRCIAVFKGAGSTGQARAERKVNEARAELYKTTAGL